jgi:hypothetical protein
MINGIDTSSGIFIVPFLSQIGIGSDYKGFCSFNQNEQTPLLYLLNYVSYSVTAIVKLIYYGHIFLDELILNSLAF